MPHVDILLFLSLMGMDRHEKLLDRVSELYFRRERKEGAKKQF